MEDDSELEDTSLHTPELDQLPKSKANPAWLEVEVLYSLDTDLLSCYNHSPNDVSALLRYKFTFTDESTNINVEANTNAIDFLHRFAQTEAENQTGQTDIKLPMGVTVPVIKLPMDPNYWNENYALVQELARRTVLLRGDAGLLHITETLIDKDAPDTEGRFELINRLSSQNFSSVGIVDALTLSPVVNLVTVIHSLVRVPEQLARFEQFIIEQWPGMKFHNLIQQPDKLGQLNQKPISLLAQFNHLIKTLQRLGMSSQCLYKSVGLGRLEQLNNLTASLGVTFHVKDEKLHHRMIHREGKELRPLCLASEGTIQALILYYALTGDADNFILDEPGSKLHPSFHSKLRSQLVRLVEEGKVVYINTHLPSLLSPKDDRLLHFSYLHGRGTIINDLCYHQKVDGASQSILARAFYFAEFVVLLEGKIDYGFFTTLQLVVNPHTRLGAVLQAVHFADCHASYKNFLPVFRTLPTHWVLLTDADALDGVCRKDSHKEKMAQHYEDKYKKIRTLLKGNEPETVIKELPLVNTWLKLAPTVRATDPVPKNAHELGKTLQTKLRPLLDSSEEEVTKFAQQCEIELRDFLQRKLRTYVWPGVHNGAIETILSTNKDRTRGTDYDHNWERIAQHVEEEWEKFELNPEGEAEYKYHEMLKFLHYLVKKFEEFKEGLNTWVNIPRREK